MKRFMHVENEGQTLHEIKEKTKTEIESINKDDFRLIGTQQEQIQAAEDMINEMRVRK